MTCIITDDEQNSRETLRHLLAAIASDVVILAEAKNTEQTKRFVEKLKPDILFLDINMPEQSGIEFLEEHPNLNCHVIFTTAYNEYVVKAFRLNAIDFLLKPIDPDELESALNKARKQLTYLQPEQLKLTKQLLFNHDEKALQRLAVPTSNGTHFIDIHKIIWMEGDGAYTKFKIEAQSNLMASKSLKEYEDILIHHSFVRVHQSYLINISHINKYIKGDGGQLIMSDGTEIEVSRRKKDELKEILKSLSL